MTLEQLIKSYTLLLQRVIKLENENNSLNKELKSSYIRIDNYEDRIYTLEKSNERQTAINGMSVTHLQLEKAINQVRKKMYKPSFWDFLKR